MAGHHMFSELIKNFTPLNASGGLRSKMPVGDADKIRGYATCLVEDARREGKTTITFRAGDIHDALGLIQAHPNVCQVLKGEFFHTQARVEFLRYVHRPPSGQGANLEIEFKIL